MCTKHVKIVPQSMSQVTWNKGSCFCSLRRQAGALFFRRYSCWCSKHFQRSFPREESFAFSPFILLPVLWAWKEERWQHIKNPGWKMDRNQKEERWLEMDPENHLLPWQLPFAGGGKNYSVKHHLWTCVLLTHNFLYFPASLKMFYIFN